MERTIIDTISHLAKLTCYCILKRFYSLKKRDIAPFLIRSREIFFFTVLITYAVQCGIFNAISKKNFRYSRFVKRIIAIEAQLYFLGLVNWTIVSMTSFLKR